MTGVSKPRRGGAVATLDAPDRSRDPAVDLEALTELTAHLLETADLDLPLGSAQSTRRTHSRDLELRPLPGGANNRVYAVGDADAATDQPVAVLKVYSRHPDDPRDRLRAEHCFSRFAWSSGLRCTPRPLAWDPRNGLGLYAFIPGRRPEPAEIDEAAVEQAIHFFRRLNQSRHLPEAGELAEASEACFSIPAHIDLVEARVRRLLELEPSSRSHQRPEEQVVRRLLMRWRQARARCESLLARSDSAVAREIPPEQRCLSPSDFGFHNAILTPEGKMVFHDFEYAGWDDPARTAVDLFCQPAVPIPHQYLERFSQAIVGSTIGSTICSQVDQLTASPGPVSSSCAASGTEPSKAWAELHRARIELLLPIYRIKWVCILLNELLPAGRHRRHLATGEDLEARKAAQINKAHQALDRIDASLQ